MAGLLLDTREDDPKQPEYPALIVANYVFGASGFSSRLFTRVRGKEGLSYGVSSGLTNNSLDHVAHFAATATAAPENMPKVERAFREELQRLYDEGITQDELDKAKQGIAQQRRQSRTQDESLANAWIEKLYRDRTWVENERADRALQAVRREDLQRAVRMHLDPKKLSVIEAGTLP